MTNTPRGDGPDPTQPWGPQLPAVLGSGLCGPDPLWAHLPGPQAHDPTRQLPPYSPYGYDPYAPAGHRLRAAVPAG